MTKEDKELLLKDLCARLPYGIKVSIEHSKGKYTQVYDLREIDNDATSELRRQVAVWNYGIYSSVISYPLRDCRPYLRPMSSMIEEEEIEFKKIFELELKALESPEGHTIESAASSAFAIDFYNKYHFDYRGLIEKGLAIEVTKENNPYK